MQIVYARSTNGEFYLTESQTSLTNLKPLSLEEVQALLGNGKEIYEGRIDDETLFIQAIGRLRASEQNGLETYRDSSETWCPLDGLPSDDEVSELWEHAPSSRAPSRRVPVR